MLCSRHKNTHPDCGCLRQISTSSPRSIQGSESVLGEHISKTVRSSQKQTREEIWKTRAFVEDSAHKTIESIGVGQAEILAHIDRRVAESVSIMSTQFEKHLPGKVEQEPATSLLPWASIHRRTVPRLRIPSALCNSQCSCLCHSTGYYGQWEFSGLQSILGSIKVSFSGVRLSHQPCTDTNCKDLRRHMWLKLQYSFPRWLAQAIMTVFFSQYDSPELLLRVHWVVPPDCISVTQSIFGKVESGDLEGVKAIIRRRPSAVHDVRGLDGWSPLFLAVESLDIPMVKILIQAGADPFHEANGRAKPARQALLHFMARTPGASQLVEIIPLDVQLEEDEFSDLHRVLLGLLPIDLQTALANPALRAQINSQTARQLTPLHIAAVRHTAKEVLLLLEAGAQLNSRATVGSTPLHMACMNARVDVAAVLLAAGATVHISTYRDVSPLHVASNVADCSYKLIDLLLEHGANINAALSDTWATPIFFAARLNALSPLKRLIERGADMEWRDHEGLTALYDAILTNASQAAEILLARGAGYHRTNNYGQGVLHLLAARGDSKTIEVFTRAKLRGLDPELVDNDGKTATEHLRARNDVDDEVRVAFKALLESIGTGGGEAIGGKSDEDWDSDSGIDDFHDALEGPEIEIQNV
ncbi:ankyrin repeat-containing domain protein [Cercophora newfieldiana]|uniref:Ankyrin repeat-containing domain protein n=1 Tax=Cercophora newfieldiana TaxID=92897 RepID=A0AA39XXA2_9PEZI|nr:ankyrin repeat-containing domain protein [Cercophora newfieldiana]